MGAIQIKNVPEDLRRAIRSRAALEGVTVSEYVLKLIRKDLRKPTVKEWLDSLTGIGPVREFDSAALIRELREDHSPMLEAQAKQAPPRDDREDQ